MIRPLWKELHSSEVAKLLLITGLGGGSVQSCCTLHFFAVSALIHQLPLKCSPQKGVTSYLVFLNLQKTPK